MECAADEEIVARLRFAAFRNQEKPVWITGFFLLRLGKGCTCLADKRVNPDDRTDNFFRHEIGYFHCIPAAGLCIT